MLTNRWLPLILDEGQHARAQGHVIRLGGGFGLVTDGGSVVTSASGEAASASLCVTMRSATPGPDLAAFEGQVITAQGVWQDRVLIVDSAEAASASGPIPQLGRPFTESSGQHTPVAPEEWILFDEGVLLHRWKSRDKAGAVRIHALATEPERVRPVLTRLYSEPIDIIRARWGNETLAAIESALVGDDEGLVKSVGRDIGPSSQAVVAVSLLHLPSTFAHRLAAMDFPPDALELGVLVKPAESPHAAGG